MLKVPSAFPGRPLTLYAPSCLSSRGGALLHVRSLFIRLSPVRSLVVYTVCLLRVPLCNSKCAFSCISLLSSSSTVDNSMYSFMVRGGCISSFPVRSQQVFSFLVGSLIRYTQLSLAGTFYIPQCVPHLFPVHFLPCLLRYLQPRVFTPGLLDVLRAFPVPQATCPSQFN